MSVIYFLLWASTLLCTLPFFFVLSGIRWVAQLIADSIGYLIDLDLRLYEWLKTLYFHNGP